MATTTIYADSSRGVIYNSGTDWEAVTTATTGASVSTTASQTYALRAAKQTGRGGTQYFDHRSFAYFDTSTITTAITAATLKIHGNGSSNDGGTIYCYLGTAFGVSGADALDTADYAEWSNTAYSSTSFSYLSWNTGALNSFTINATGITAMNDDGVLNIALITINTITTDEPTVTLGNLGIDFKTSGTSRIQLVITHADAQEFQSDINGVENANIGNVLPVTVTNITNVIGTS
tara:strand:+ start:559 stop:1260 length:702 start_codon:yes stop_codon:yes gene_type:complete